MRRKEEPTTGDMVINVLLAVLIPMAAAGIWFLANVCWWE